MSSEAQGRLDRAGEWLRELHELAPDAMVTVDQEGRIVLINTQAELLFGYGRGELLGQPVEVLIPGRLAGPHVERREDYLREPKTRAKDAELRLEGQRRDGTVFPAEISLAPLATGEGLLITAAVRDITRRVQLKQRLAQAERLSSLGTVAAGICHEINNPLAYVLGNLDYGVDAIEQALAGLARGDQIEGLLREVQSALREARDGAERVKGIARDVRTFTRAHDDRAPLELAGVLDAAEKMTVHAVRATARVRKEHRGPCHVRGNQGELTQVLMNLILNAAQAMAGGEVGEILLTTGVDEQGRAVAAVSDNGAGIAPEVLPRIFDPFFTTKPPGAGTGLGLAICRDIVVSHGGEITVESQPGQGTTFRVVLPSIAPPAQGPARPSLAAAPPVRRGKLLVIDDEPTARMIQRMLRDAFDVEATPEGHEALRRLFEGARYDAILCNQRLTDLRGREVFQKLAERLPEQARGLVLLSSGPSSRDDEAGDIPCLTKPFDQASLRDLLRGLIDDKNTP